MSALTPSHVDLLADGAIPSEVAEAAGTYSVGIRDGLPVELRDFWSGPGLVFLHHPLSGDGVPQYRPDTPRDDPSGRPRKYVFPQGPVPLNIVPAMRGRVGAAPTVLIVEGTKQTLAAVAHVGPDVLVVGMAGCFGWSRDGIADPELAELDLTGRRVVVALDADVSTNANVWEAGDRLGQHLAMLGATTVAFVALPASDKIGLDDYLASIPDAQRSGVLARLIDTAKKLPRRPPRPVGVGAAYFDHDGLRVVDVVEAVLAGGHYAVGPDGSIWAYCEGVYVDNDPMVGALRGLLANQYRPIHRKAIEEVMVDELRTQGRVLGDRQHPGLVNVANGMLSVSTGELEPHDPDLLSSAQLPVAWDPDATCPTFDAWLLGRVGTQAEDLLESLGLVLCPDVAQRKTVFLFGPQRSGKSTLLRLVEAVVGPKASTAVTLHQLSTNRFAAASLYGRLLNVAGDLSDHHVEDLSTFKQLTGDDLVAGERKFRDPFTFHNRALFVFSANQPPTVAETTRAYLARIRPYVFPDSVEGREDPTLDARLLGELQGVLVRLVEGAQRWLARGGYAPGNPLVADEFAQQSDVAALFAAQVIAASPGSFLSGKAAFDAYTEWASANGRGRLGRNKFLARLDNTLGSRQRPVGSNTGATGWRDVTALDPSEWIDPDPLARFASSSFTSPYEEKEREEEGDARKGKVGGDRANRARPEPEPVLLDPAETIEMAF